MTRVKEIRCSSCEHLLVCALKDTFLNAQRAADDLAVGTGGNGVVRIIDMPWLSVNLNCEHFKSQTNTR